MEPRRRREWVLAGVVVVLSVIAYSGYTAYEQRPDPSAARPSTSTGQGSATRPERSTGSGPEAPDVHLGALDADRPRPDTTGRDLFRFKQRPVPRQPPPLARPVEAPPPAPAGPPPPPPITLKFIGFFDSPAPGARLAILSDGRGVPMYGREGETVLGQYRILRIGAESIEMSYLDGRGRQTIRLSGS